MPKFNYDVCGFPACCGLDIVYEMWVDPDSKNDNRMVDVLARVAVTAPSQTDVVEQLKKDDFKEVGQFVGNSGDMLTLWLRQRDYEPDDYEDDDY